MLLKLINNTPVEYSISQLRLDNPNVSFPYIIPDSTLKDYNVFPYTVESEPEVDTEKQKVINGGIEFIGDSWVKRRLVVDLNEEELSKVFNKKQAQLKLQGVEFEGIMCSATKEDMWGLNATKDWIIAGNSTNFEFDNGNVLTLTPENYQAFMDVWVPFRASFFQE